MLSAFHWSAIVSLSIPEHSRVISSTLQFVKSGFVSSDKVNVAVNVVSLPQSSEIV